LSLDRDEKNNQAVHHGNWLGGYGRNTFSQCGEDGIIEKVVSLLPDVTKWCVEFGAWDGKHFSNTHALLSQKGWSGVLIEGDQSKFRELCQTYQGNERVTCLHKTVSFRGEDLLDNLLAHTAIPRDFDLLSIDIDGNDLHVWQALVDFRPKLVVIEFNPSIPNDVEFVQEANTSVNQGSSLLSLCKLARTKNYELVGVTEINAFFIEGEYFPLFQMQDNSPATINSNDKHVTRVFQLYDGTLVWRGNRTLLWHDLDMDPAKLQVLPTFCRRFPGTRVSWWRRFLCSCWKKWNALRP
jgi:hypothetical protein